MANNMSNQSTLLKPHTNNLLGPLADYISTPNIFDMFNFFEDYKVTSFPLHNTLNNETSSTGINELLSVSTNPLINNSFFKPNFDFFLNTSDLLYSFEPIIQPMSDDIQRFSITTNNLYDLNDIFPEKVTQFECFEFSSMESDISAYETLSTPETKIFYPEPFIASPSFVHEELWFMHILHFQHWLWFFFISLIMFFFITFVNVVRWCNLRTRPRRETRGVSRSKCADLITACVPVSWAAAIIITETVDATDYYDGFGTGEIVVGIRAYQWGWEYFYPKSIDLNYNVNPSYSSIVGNSLKYTSSSSTHLKANTLWKYHQNKNTGSSTSTPAHLLLLPNDNSNILNFMNFDEIGLNTVKDSTAFKKIQFFSKTNTESIFNLKSDFESNYYRLSSLYNTDLKLMSSLNYGISRQHNYSSLASSNRLSTTSLDKNSVDKFFSYNLNTELQNSSLNDNSYIDSTTQNMVDVNKSEPTLQNFFFENNQKHFLNTANSYPLLKSFSDIETDSKKNLNPVKAYNNANFKKKNLLYTDWLSSTTLTQTDLVSSNPLSSYVSDIFNKESVSKFKNLKSNDLQLLSSERNVRLLGNYNSPNYNHNFSKYGNDASSINEQLKNLHSTTNQNSLYTLSKLNWSNLDQSVRLFNNSVSMPTEHAPIMSSSPYFNNTSYDFFEKNEDDLTPNMLKSKDESAPSHIFNTYWVSYWANTDNWHRYKNLENLNLLNSSIYIPTFNEYAEYDFKNWQAIELLEDAFWESTYSSYVHDEYCTSFQNTTDLVFLKKNEELFNLFTRKSKDKKLKSGLLKKSFLSENSHSSNLTPLTLFNETSVPNTQLLPLKSFNFFSDEATLDSMDNVYENAKYLNYLYLLNYKHVLNYSLNSIMPISYVTILDSFCANYEDSYLYSDFFENDNVDWDNNTHLALHNDIRLSNPLKLRSTAKSAIVTYNAIQKVFRSRLDEGRSNTRLQDFSNSFVKHPLLTDNRINYESLLGKNKENFLQINSFNHNIKSNINNLYLLINTNNIYFIDLPFLMSLKSDPSRYLWFDWASKWSSIEISAASVSRFSLLGLPYPNKSFEYATSVGDEISENETYLIKLAKARKNYMSNWAFTPYFYSRVSNWYNLNTFNNLLFNNQSLYSTRYLLSNSSWYWSKIDSVQSTSSLSTFSYSNVNAPSRSSWKPISGIESSYYNQSILADILSRREYVYRQFFSKKSFKPLLPKYLLATPTNPIFEEVQKNFSLIDPINFSAESSRELFYRNTNKLNFLLLKDIISAVDGFSYNVPLNLSVLNNYLYLYIFGNYNSMSSGLNYNSELYKNQYCPMKKGVSNMIKLHATGAIAMPIEIRLHLLASSKDVIHSWAIPSAGIKIDCVPGYSSHRVTIFLVSGIFWGQCMEICGRFHHWMPIIVYFMKRDLFFLWCTHFMHYSPTENTFTTADKQLSDFTKPVSFDNSNWISEINKLV